VREHLNDIWDLAKDWFVIKLWGECHFFLNASEKDEVVDRCATEAYEAAVNEHPDSAEIITKRLQTQQSMPAALIECREVLLPAAILQLETALEIARKAVAKEYGFQALVVAGNLEKVKELASSALHQSTLDHPCIKEVLVVLYFEKCDWGQRFGHLFENKFSLQVLALAVSMTRVALNEWLTDTVGMQTWARAGSVEVFNKILTYIMKFEDGAVKVLNGWWSSAAKRAQPNLDFTYTLPRTPSATASPLASTSFPEPTTVTGQYPAP